MENIYRKVLERWASTIAEKSIDVKRITEELISGGILGEDDRQKILSETTAEYNALRLLDLLSEKGSKAFQVFLQALNDSGSTLLANAMQSELSGIRKLFDFVC